MNIARAGTDLMHDISRKNSYQHIFDTLSSVRLVKGCLDFVTWFCCPLYPLCCKMIIFASDTCFLSFCVVRPEVHCLMLVLLLVVSSKTLGLRCSRCCV